MAGYSRIPPCQRCTDIPPRLGVVFYGPWGCVYRDFDAACTTNLELVNELQQLHLIYNIAYELGEARGLNIPEAVKEATSAVTDAIHFSHP